MSLTKELLYLFAAAWTVWLPEDPVTASAWVYLYFIRVEGVTASSTVRPRPTSRWRCRGGKASHSRGHIWHIMSTVPDKDAYSSKAMPAPAMKATSMPDPQSTPVSTGVQRSLP